MKRRFKQIKKGDVFGRWTVIDDNIILKNNRMYVRCKCECGTEKTVTTLSLNTGRSKSCGCLRAEKSKKQYDEYMKEVGKESNDFYNFANTKITSLTEKISKNNTTGVKGVSKNKDGRFRAYLTIHGKQIFLGMYDTLAEAKKARLQGEEIYYKPIIERHREEKDPKEFKKRMEEIKKEFMKKEE